MDLIAAGVCGRCQYCRDGRYNDIASPAGLEHAVGLSMRSGIVVVIGVPSAPVSLPLPQSQDAQIRLHGSAMHVGPDVERALRMIADGILRAEDFVTSRHAGLATARPPGEGG